jgi:hypothetical protein
MRKQGIKKMIVRMLLFSECGPEWEEQRWGDDRFWMYFKSRTDKIC